MLFLLLNTSDVLVPDMDYPIESLLEQLDQEQLDTHVQFLSDYGLAMRVANMFERHGTVTVRDCIILLIQKKTYIAGVGVTLISQLEEALHRFATDDPVQVEGAPTPEEIKERCEEIQSTWSEQERESRVVGPANKRMELNIIPYPKTGNGRKSE